MRYRVLGPLQVEDASGPVRLGGRKEQAVLAQLLARVNSAVPADRIAFGLWEDAPPASAARTLQAYVARLRHSLRSAADGRQDRIITVANGWALHAEPGHVDALRFESLVRSGRAALEAGRFVDAAQALSEALEMWRGQAYAGFDEVADCRAEAMRLTELRLLAQDERLAALLGAGDADRVVAEAEGLLAAGPLRERRWGLLIHALYASGRQAEALNAYAQVADLLREELGVEPGPELQRLHSRVLAHDPRLLSLAGRPVELPPAFVAGGPLFVGRDPDLAYLAERWSGAVAGCGGVLLLAGDTGVGKSRLVAALARRAAAEAAEVVDATPDSGNPGGSLREALGASGFVWPATGAPRAVARSAAVEGRPEPPRLIVVDAAQQLPPAAAAALAEVHHGLVDRATMVVVAYRDDEATAGAAALASLDLPRLHIDRLADAEIAAIARSYETPGFEIDVGRVVAGSAGLPQRAHHLAGRAAALAASRRVSSAASRALKGYHGLTALRDELTANVQAAQRVRRHAALYAEMEPVLSYRSPYKGLAPFDLDDAGVFHGRDAAVADLMARLAVENALIVVGPSGSGKSSLVRAGLLAGLRNGGLPGSEQWRMEVVTPGSGWQAPASGPSRLLVVDQLEELFTVVPAERAAELIQQLMAESRSGKVVATLRSDFYPDAAADPDLGRALERGTVLLRQMRPDELRRAITEPARVLGFEVADDLVDSALADVSGQPGALPLLSVALEETFRRRTGRVLERAAYESAGGVAGALARLAEEAYQPLDAAQRTAARRVLLRLSEEDNGRVVRRRAAFAELCPPGDLNARAAIEALAARRLLVLGDGTVEVAHEALLAAWDRCRSWLADDAAGRQVRTHLTATASAWQAGGRSDADLYRGARLVAAADWATNHGGDLTALEREYLEVSQAGVERQRRAAEARALHEARQSRRLRLLLAAVAVLLVASLAAAGQALRSAEQAREHATAADAARLGSLALTESRIDLAALLAAQAVALHPSAETRADLLATLLRHPEVRRVTSPLGSRLFALGVSPDGRLLAVGNNRGQVALVDAATWRRRGSVLDVGGGRYPVRQAAFSPDGRHLAVLAETPGGEVSQPMTGVLTVWEIATGRVVQHARTAGFIAFRWAPPGSRVAAVSSGPDADVTWAGAVGSWVPTEHRHDRLTTWPVAFDSGGRRVLMTDGLGWAVWRDVPGWTPLGRVPVGPDAVPAVRSPDGRVLAVGTGSGLTRIIDSTTGRVLRTLTGQRGGVEDVRFDATGRRVVTTANDGTAVVWEVATGHRVWSITGLGGALALNAAFAPDGARPGDRVYVASHDGTLIEADLTDGVLGRRVPVPAGGTDAAWPAGAMPVLVTNEPSRLSVIGEAGGSRGMPITDGAITSLSAVPESALLVVGLDSGRVGVVNADGRLIRWLGHPPAARVAITGLAAGPRGEFAVAARDDGHLLAYDGRSGATRWDRVLGPPAGDDQPTPTTVAYDAARNRLAVGFGDGTVHLVDPATGRRGPAVVVMPDRVFAPAIAFEPGTGTLLVGARDGSLQFRDPATGQAVADPVPGPPSSATTIITAQTGHHAMTLGLDGSVAVWDIAARRVLGVLPTHGAGASALALAPTGDRALVVEPDGSATMWNLDEATWYDAACARAGRQLTEDEWRRFLPNRSYAPACAA